MDIIIQYLGFKARNGLEAYVNEKVGKLGHFADNIIRANVTLFLGPPSDPNNAHCEIRLEIPGNDHFAQKKAPDFEQAVIDTVEALHRIMEKHKGKITTNRQS